ncbi:MAG: MFS transporter [Promethearchaeota archaeon]
MPKNKLKNSKENKEIDLDNADEDDEFDNKFNNEKEPLSSYKGFSFLIFLILIEMAWILGTKSSDMLLDLMNNDLSTKEIQRAEQYFFYSLAITTIFWGIIVDRAPKKRKLILLISNLIWILASIVLFFSNVDYNIYFMVQVFWGIAFGANAPILGSYLGDLFRINKRGILFSIFTIFVYIIKGSAIAVNGIIGNLLRNWKAPMFIFAIMGVVILIIFILKADEPKLASIEPEVMDKINQGFDYDKKITIKGVLYVLTIPTNILFLLQGISGMIGVTVVTRYMNYWFTSEQGMGMDTVAAVIILGSGGAIGALAGILIAGKFADKRFNQKRMNRILSFATASLFLQVVSYVILTFMLKYPDKIDPQYNSIFKIFQYYPVFYWFLFVFNICVFFGTPIGTTVKIARTHVNLPEHRGTAASLYDLFDSIGAGIGLGVGWAIYSKFNNYQTTVMLGSLFWLISGGLWLLINFYYRQDYLEMRHKLQHYAQEL